MMKSELYKGACQLLFMGAPEALIFLDALESSGLLSRRTVSQYVLPALYGGSQTKEGTEGYRALEEQVFGEVFGAMTGRLPGAADDPREEAVSHEGGTYLRGILEVATGDGSHRMVLPGSRYDGFSRGAFDEVRRLLGKTGMGYLGISGRHESLQPSPSMVSAIMIDDESEGIPYSTRGRGPLCVGPAGNDPFFEEMREEMRRYEEWLEAEEEREIEEAAECAGEQDVPYRSVFSVDL